jgi:hypothetical protein
MAEVVLKVNMIIGGTHYPFGTKLEEDIIPDHLLIDEYVSYDGSGVFYIEAEAARADDQGADMVDQEPDLYEEMPKRLVKKAVATKMKGKHG